LKAAVTEIINKDIKESPDTRLFAQIQKTYFKHSIIYPNQEEEESITNGLTEAEKFFQRFEKELMYCAGPYNVYDENRPSMKKFGNEEYKIGLGSNSSSVFESSSLTENSIKLKR
jgi:FMN phosphatase YigB (HAD superfamily)